MNNTVKLPDEIMNIASQHVNNPLVKKMMGYEDLDDFIISAMKGIIEADLGCLNIDTNADELQEVYN